MSEGSSILTKLDKWMVKYSSTGMALLCLFNVIIGWGENWILTGIFGAGVLILGTIAFFDIKRANNKQRSW